MKKFISLLLAAVMMFCMSATAFAESGGSADGGGMSVVIGVVVGVIIAVIVMLVLKGQLKSVHMEHAARNYIKQGSFKLTASRDIYLYKKVDRTVRQKDNN